MPVFENCYFEYNYAKSAPAIGLYGESDTKIIGCTFNHHRSTGTYIFFCYSLI